MKTEHLEFIAEMNAEAVTMVRDWKQKYVDETNARKTAILAADISRMQRISIICCEILKREKYGENKEEYGKMEQTGDTDNKPKK